MCFCLSVLATGFGPTLIQHGDSLTWPHLPGPYYQIRSHSEVAGGHELWVDTIIQTLFSFLHWIISSMRGRNYIHMATTTVSLAHSMHLRNNCGRNTFLPLNFYQDFLSHCHFLQQPQCSLPLNPWKLTHASAWKLNKEYWITWKKSQLTLLFT